MKAPTHISVLSILLRGTIGASHPLQGFDLGHIFHLYYSLIGLNHLSLIGLNHLKRVSTIRVFVLDVRCQNMVSWFPEIDAISPFVDVLIGGGLGASPCLFGGAILCLPSGGSRGLLGSSLLRHMC